jgi:CDP-glycerol glycerophosphotransferase (TagB/SpsB family)
MNSFIRKILRKISRDLIAIFTKRIKNRIILIKESSSGSNSYALWKFASENIKNKYELKVYQDSLDEGQGIIHYIKKYRLISSSQLIITTHASYKPSKNHIHLQLWHGCSTKNSGIFEQNDDQQKFILPWRNVDYIMSYSKTYTTFLNAQMLSAPWKYRITGAPRNDFLFHSDGASNLNRIFGDAIKGKKIIFYLPTYKKNNSNCWSEDKPNIFGFPEFVIKKFDKFLLDSNCKLIFKPHPHENSEVLNFKNKNKLNNILIFSDEDLSSNYLDLYELLNGSDILITDYSSVFYDYLLLDKPMIFAPVDIDSRLENDGFLIESFENWAPGPKAYDQDELQIEISKCLEKKDYYAEKRAWMRNLHHRYKDGKSSERLWEFIESVM